MVIRIHKHAKFKAIHLMGSQEKLGNLSGRADNQSVCHLGNPKNIAKTTD